MRKKGPLRLMERTLVQACVLVEPVGAKLSITPAQLIRMSMLALCQAVGVGGCYGQWAGGLLEVED